MDKNMKFVYAGNRPYVLREMLDMNVNLVDVWVMEGGFLHKELMKDPWIEYTLISSKEQLLDLIEKTTFDIFVSSGVCWILPISKCKNAVYVNFHESYLPDLKGNHPMIGSMLFGRKAGATCHIMDDGIDSGKIISRVEVPVTEDIDAELLYQLCFMASKVAFRQAYKNNFEPMSPQPIVDNPIYYTMKEFEQFVDFNKGSEFLLRQAKAFGCKTKGIYFKCNDKLYRCFGVDEITNSFAVNYYKNEEEKKILLLFENHILFKYDNKLLRIKQIENVDENLKIGNFLESV